MEFLRIVKENDNNIQRLISKNLWKILKQDLSMAKLQDFPKFYCIKVTDYFLAKKIGFVVTIQEISSHQVEFKLYMKESVYEFLEPQQNSSKYLNTVLDKMFSDILLYKGL